LQLSSPITATAGMRRVLTAFPFNRQLIINCRHLYAW
jgi:hypothetical protein